MIIHEAQILRFSVSRTFEIDMRENLWICVKAESN